MKRFRAILSLFLVVAVCLPMMSCRDSGEAAEGEEIVLKTLNVGCGQVSGYFNPFYVSEGADADICEVTGVKLFEYERGGNVVLDTEPVKYQGEEYTYEGIASCDMQIADDGGVTYDITLRDDVYFSDGERLTADDVIFTLYVLADPSYDGPYSIATLPINGINDYRAGMFVLSDMICRAGESNTDYSYWSEELHTLYWDTLKGEAGKIFAQEIIDHCIGNGLAKDVVSAIKAWGYGDYVRSGVNYTAEDFFRIMCENAGNDYESFAYTKAAGRSLFEITEELLSEKDPIYATAIMVSESELTVRGIEKTGEFSLRVSAERYDASVIYALACNIAPLHYYGDESLFDPDNGSFGFKKGDLTSVKKISEPLGAGPYSFSGFNGDRVSLLANENYYLGEPETGKIDFVVCTSYEEMVNGVADGTIDICAPDLSEDIVTAIMDLNGNGQLNGDVISYSSVDFNGYGFIGINASKVCVNGEPDSTASKNLRKAFAILFAVYREEAVAEYYGELAEVIEYPMSSASWAAPVKGDAGYATAYSYGYDGMSIYSEDMTREQRYEAALDAAVDCLVAAGYEWNYWNECFDDAPYGARLTYTIIVPGDGKGDHPCYAIAEKVKEALGTVGIELVINDPADTNQLWTALNSGSQDMWCAAWTGSIDPDLYRVYYSGNTPASGYGTGKNYFYLTDSSLDVKILSARAAANTYYRKKEIFDCLNIILNWAVEIPVYQRQQAYIFNSKRIEAQSMPENMTPYRNWLSSIWQIKVK